jgi:hypothetical protein
LESATIWWRIPNPEYQADASVVWAPLSATCAGGLFEIRVKTTPAMAAGVTIGSGKSKTCFALLD